MGAGRFRFGLFEFDAAKLELRREGVLVRLQPQPAQTLAFLIEHAGQVVSREDLRNAVWDGKTFVDFEGGLNFCISEIRSALRDDSTHPTYIRTVPKSGYQFIAPVQPLSAQLPQQPSSQDGRQAAPGIRKAAVALVLATLATLAFLGYHFRSVQSASGPPILAVLRFDNETADPKFAQFSDSLTDNVIVQLTSQSKGSYRVIGNAQILRLPPEQRDLKAIASSLHAAYVVLGQVQSNGTQIRILAHLIRLSDETHIWVIRIDRQLGDPLSVESEIASKIAAEFSERMSEDPSRATSFPSANN
jgi:DNA-binding winged helix-turn-helix (wHTH) protein/TolB-like protein